MDYGYIVRFQCDLFYTIERVFSVCDKPYQMNNGFQQMWADTNNLWNYALLS